MDKKILFNKIAHIITILNTKRGKEKMLIKTSDKISMIINALHLVIRKR